MASALGNADARPGWIARVKLWRVLLWFQGLYFFVTGVWPLISIESFQMVTGPKTDHLVTGHEADHWLVMTVGVLVAAIGAALCTAGWRNSFSAAIVVLAIGSSVGLTAIDVIYVAREVIPPIYLMDALVEVVLIAAWCAALMTRRY